MLRDGATGRRVRDRDFQKGRHASLVSLFPHLSVVVHGGTVKVRVVRYLRGLVKPDQRIPRESVVLEFGTRDGGAQLQKLHVYVVESHFHALVASKGRGEERSDEWKGDIRGLVM